MSQTRVNTARPSTRRGGRGTGNGKGFQSQTNNSFPINNEEPKGYGEEDSNKRFTNRNVNRGAFKQTRRKSHKKVWSDNSSNTQNSFHSNDRDDDHFFHSTDWDNEDEPVLEEHFNTRFGGNTSRGFNRQGRLNDHQQMMNDNSKRISRPNDQQRAVAVEYVEREVNKKGKTYNTTADQSSQSNESLRRPYSSGSRGTSSRAQTFSDLSVHGITQTQRNVSKPPEHAQNPIFVNEIMQRFNSILPPPSRSPEKPQVVSDDANLECGGLTFGSFNVDEVFRQFQNPTQQSNNKLPNENKRGNGSKEHNPFQTVGSDSKNASPRHSYQQMLSQGGSYPGPSRMIDRNVREPNVVLERKEILKPSGNAANGRPNSYDKTNACHMQSAEPSLGAVLFAQLDEFQSKNKSQYEKVNTQTTVSRCKTPPCLMDNNRYNFPPTNKPPSSSQRNRDPEFKPGPSGYLNRSPNIASNVVPGRTEILKSSGDAAENNRQSKTNAHHNQPSEQSMGTVPFESTNKFQYDQANAQITTAENNRHSKTNAHHNQPLKQSMGTVPFESKNEFQYDQTNTQITTAQHKTTTPDLIDNIAASKSNPNSIKGENPPRNVSESASKSEKLNPVIQNPSCNDQSQSSKFNKRDLIFRQFGFEGNPSRKNSDFNNEKQHVKSSTETALSTPSKTLNSNLENEQQKQLASQSNQTATLSKPASKSANSSQWPGHSQDKPTTFQGEQPRPLLQKTPVAAAAQQSPEVYKNKSECFITRSNNASSLTDDNITGGNVYNIHQPARHIGQGAITRDESVRRLENEYAEKLRVHKIKEEEKEAKKREEWLEKYKYIDQGHRLSEGYLDEAVGGQAYRPIESEEEIRQRQQEQFRRDALVFQELERKRSEERIRREEEMTKQKLERYKHVTSGHRLDDNNAEAYRPIESEDEIRQRQQEQLRRDALAFQEQQRKKNEERVRREEEMTKQNLERYKHVSSGHRLGGDNAEARVESENMIGQLQQQQLRRDVLIHQEQARKANEDRIRKEAKQPNQELDKCKQESSSQRLSGSINEGSPPEKGERKKIEHSGQVNSPTDITSLFVEFMKTSGIMKKYTNGETDELLSQFQTFMSNAKKTPETKVTNSQPASNETPASSDSQNVSKDHSSCTLASTSKGPVLVIRPCQEALDRAVSQNLALQDMDKHGQSPLYEPQIEQTPAFSNNRFERKQPEFSNKRHEQHFPSETSLNRVNQWKPQSETIGTRKVEKSLDEIAKLTGAIPKQKPMVMESRSPDCTSTTSNEPGRSEEVEIDFQEEMRAARLKMQKRYEEALKKEQNN